MVWALSAIQLGLGIASAFGGSYSSKKLDKIMANNAILQAKNAVSNFSQQANSNNTSYAQEQESTWQQAQQVYLENLRAKATAQASAVGSGITGNSIDNLFRGYDRANALNNFIAERNLRNMGLAYDNNYEALRTNAINSIYGIQGYSGATAGSTMLSSISQLIPQSLGLYNSYKGVSK